MDHDSSHSYVYVDNPNSNLLCCICRMPFVEPLTSRTCAHSFCRHCITPALRASPHCPIDRSPLSLQDMAPSSPIVRHMVDELILLAAHLKDDCLFAEEQCPDPECSRRALRKDILGDHALCPHRLVVCDTCATEIKASELAAHSRACSMKAAQCPSCNLEYSHSEAAHAEVCPAAIVACQQASHGCDWTGVRLALKETHARTCPYVAIQGFFRISDAKVAALETENARLRARLHSAEGMLAVMRHELQAIKSALGPWYRPDTRPESASLSQSQAFAQPVPYSFSTPSSTSAPAYHWRGHQEPPADVMVHVPITFGEDSTVSATVDSVSLTTHGPHAGITPSDLAAYFPPSSGDASGPLSPSTASRHSLSAALTALRTALQTHDARSRMTASAHAAELAAMRQVVAGLRMQLHAVLMERSGSNADGSGAGPGHGGWNPAARFFLNLPPLGGHSPTAASITKL
ncbi:hypothetical protein BC827DRAFT_85738 [Russula dissimulans]|nr:hypothetical protein BC827DRAFT_85738 [Russula dissimulans]